ncbi:MAG: hypothetical protein HY909_09540 [Deltaproteobacteria bacterium]|nr:hypothetical protein [Deltaproteobacteria bacterium]
MGFLSDDPARRRLERFTLWYAPLWMTVAAVVQQRADLARWGDAEFLALGLGLALPPLATPFLGLPAVERGRALRGRFAAKAMLFVAVLSFLRAFLGARVFFVLLGMRYRFPVHLTLNGSPVFVYLLTVPYYLTYLVAMQVALRAVGRVFPSRGAAVVARAALAFGVAFAETGLMATERMASFFSYADRRFSLTWGSLCYGAVFFVTLPLFDAIDRDGPTPLGEVLRDALAAMTVILCVYEAAMVLAGLGR